MNHQCEVAAPVTGIHDGEAFAECRYVPPPPPLPTIFEQIKGLVPDPSPLLEERRAQAEARKKGPAYTENQLAVIEALEENGPLTAPDISRHSGVSKPCTWTVLYDLMGHGIIKRSGVRGHSVYSMVVLDEGAE